MSHALYRKDIISISELNRSELELILEQAARLKRNPHAPLLKNKVLGSCFFEASTRTRLSFETAIKRLGGEVIGFDDGQNTSLTQKGETLADSIKIISSYVDALILRHPQEGSARLAAEFSEVPVINAGDGANQHPTQTLLDLFSIFECQGRLDTLNIAFVGDLKYGRTVHSLAQALSLFDCNFHFIAPETLNMPEYLTLELEDQGIHIHCATDIESVMPEVDILYMTRFQKERFDETEYKHIASKYLLTEAMLKPAKPTMKVLHPLPRVDEIAKEVDATDHAYYFEQARNGVFARQALLSLVLNPQP